MGAGMRSLDGEGRVCSTREHEECGRTGLGNWID